MSISSSSEFVLLSSAPVPRYRDFLPWGFVLLRDISTSHPLTSRRPTANFWFALSVSHTLGDLLRLLPCRFISLCSHVQGLHFKGFPCRPASQALHLPVPSCRSTCRAFGRRSSLPVRQAPPSGLYPVVNPWLPSGCYTVFVTRSLRVLPALSGFRPPPIAAAFTVASAHDLFVQTLP
jgi:hypothetical protein